MSDVVTITGTAPVVTVSINRPDKLNALSDPVFDGIVDAFRRCAEAGDVRVIIFRGVPTLKHGLSSSAGANLDSLVVREGDQFKPLPYAKAKEHMMFGIGRLAEAVRLRDEAGITVIGGVEGTEDRTRGGLLLGGAVEAFLSLCHILVVSENSRIGFPEYDLDGLPGWAGPQLIRRLTGFNPQRVAWLLLNQQIDGITAERWGVVAKAVASGSVFEEIERLARYIAKRSPQATRDAFQLAKAPATRDVTHESVRMMVELMMQPDGWVSRVGAFLSKG